jgi:hypothetical protein
MFDRLILHNVFYRVCAFSQVLGSNFQYEYEANEEDEKQRKRDIFTSISVGLTEYRRTCEVRMTASTRCCALYVCAERVVGACMRCVTNCTCVLKSDFAGSGNQ